MKQVLRFFTVRMAIVLSLGNAVVGFTPVAATNVHVSPGTPADTIPLVSGLYSGILGTRATASKQVEYVKSIAHYAC
jgi:hypothetical protein